MTQSSLPIFTRTFDFLAWLLPVSSHFPRAHRLTFTLRLMNAAFDLRENLEKANCCRAEERLRLLHSADENLAKVRLYLRLAERWNWLSAGQYAHVSAMLVEIGKLLGGWIKVSTH